MCADSRLTADEAAAMYKGAIVTGISTEKTGGEEATAVDGVVTISFDGLPDLVLSSWAAYGYDSSIDLEQAPTAD